MNDIIRTAANSKVDILLYHQVGDKPNSSTNLDCFCSSEQFRQQMEYLSTSNYRVISLSQAVELIFDKKLIDSKYVVLTFDDGCERFYDITYPILDTFGFASTIFPVTGCLGKQASWGKIKNPELKILSRKKLVELDKLGVEIGAHTMDHVKLTQVPRIVAFEQVKCSKDTLAQLLGKNISSFSYPHGDYNLEVTEIIKETGFSNALTCLEKSAHEARNVYEIPRKYITYFDSLDIFKQKLAK